jgi:Ca2+-binding EF-hand superfamily protein
MQEKRNKNYFEFDELLECLQTNYFVEDTQYTLLSALQELDHDADGFITVD